MAIILRLDRVMADRKISLNDLADQVGIANVSLSKIKTGKVSAIRFSTLNAICDVLDCQRFSFFHIGCMLPCGYWACALFLP
ncbi:MAG: helix-turn-helix transcriptional regulator [Lachnospiraceae bacterium]|nr:helix-turn-helix transcriptional regulator [Lachnospiraceae bacterium]